MDNKSRKAYERMTKARLIELIGSMEWQCEDAIQKQVRAETQLVGEKAHREKLAAANAELLERSTAEYKLREDVESAIKELFLVVFHLVPLLYPGFDLDEDHIPPASDPPIEFRAWQKIYRMIVDKCEEIVAREEGIS